MVRIMIIHIVQPNETAYSIAQLYGVSVESVIFNNQLYTPSSLAVGQALLILIPEITHRVRRNETLWSIANQYEISVKELIRNNPYVIPNNYITEGQILVIKYLQEKFGDIDINGFAYPFINKDILYETLPYMTRLSIFSYGFRPSGELIPIDDLPLLEAAMQFNVRPIMVITGSNDEGNFDNILISRILNDMTSQNTLITNILNTLTEKNYSGVDIDFENILAKDRDVYVNFIRNLSQAVHPEGFTVSVDLSPKENRYQRGLLYEGLDYAGIGRYADDVLLMTYEWGYSQSQPMAVAPINKVKQILEYAITEIPREKINLGIPNYGYEWPLPYIKGVTTARSIGNVQAAEIAGLNRAVIEFDTTAMTPHFQYTINSRSFEVWFEDVRSMNSKIMLVPEYSIKGAGYWNIMRYFRANWLLVNALFNII